MEGLFGPAEAAEAKAEAFDSGLFSSATSDELLAASGDKTGWEIVAASLEGIHGPVAVKFTSAVPPSRPSTASRCGKPKA